ncbi:MAG: M23 family metallopeptidase [Alphaproteobacteria bacterium]|nr:M23 family metallopeptidase [Alphaproteobacteria bacterium]
MLRLSGLTQAAALLLLLALPARAADIAFDRPLLQGGIAVGTAPQGAKVVFAGQVLRLSPQREFVIGFGRDETAAELTLVWPGGRTETRNLRIGARKFDIQRIDGLPTKMVSPDPKDLERIKEEGRRAATVRTANTPELWWKAPFVWPVKGRISGVYGSQRILNGEPRSPHWGVDVAAPTGTPVVAPAAGIVRLSDDFYLTGLTVIIDHGYGVYSSLVHLSEMTVKDGQQVQQGETIGRVGMTGRATGPHLHWGMNLFNIRIDPELVVGPMPQG